MSNGQQTDICLNSNGIGSSCILGCDNVICLEYSMGNEGSWKRLLDAVDSYMRSKKESPANGLKQSTLENFYTLLEDKEISVDWCYTEGLNQCRPTSGEMTISIVDEETGKRRCIYKAAYDPYAKRWEEREHK